MTGIKPGAFSVSLNERSLGGAILANVFEDVLFGTTTVTHLVRQVSSFHLIQSYLFHSSISNHVIRFVVSLVL
jgi:hypothetical protein